MNKLKLMDKLTTLVQSAVDADDPGIAFQQILEMETAKELLELGKGKLVFLLSEVWEQFSVSKSESLYTQAESNLGMHSYTVDRYITMWKYEPQLPEAIQEKPVREKVIITKALAQGHDFTEDDWENLERASGDAAIRNVVRTIKKEPPRKNAVIPYLYDDGTVIVYQDGERLNAGFMDVKNTHPAVQKLIQRFIDNCGVIRK